MSPPTDSSARERALDELAQRHGFGFDAVSSLFGSIVHGRGGMAQFDHPEFSGAGQWMQGGMTMVSDMFNHTLKSRVAALCADLSALLAARPEVAADASDGASAWWPAGLGQPSSAGSQNDLRYAWFGDAQRLAIESHGKLTLYDTQDHRIGGVAQQQSGNSTVWFTSQYGTVDLGTLPVVDADASKTTGAGTESNQTVGARPEPAQGSEAHDVPRRSSADFSKASDAVDLIARLAELHAKGVLTDEEFSAKKAELLGRL